MQFSASFVLALLATTPLTFALPTAENKVEVRDPVLPPNHWERNILTGKLVPGRGKRAVGQGEEACSRIRTPPWAWILVARTATPKPAIVLITEWDFRSFATLGRGSPMVHKL